jgi:hypothetical protein
VARRCSFCHSRKCDGGPYCPRDKKPRDRERTNALARERWAKNTRRVCGKGHEYQVGAGCPTCRGERLRKQRLTPVPSPKPEPVAVYVAPLPWYAVVGEALARERAESQKRRDAFAAAAIERCRRMEALEDARKPKWRTRGGRIRRIDPPTKAQQEAA